MQAYLWEACRLRTSVWGTWDRASHSRRGSIPCGRIRPRKYRLKEKMKEYWTLRPLNFDLSIYKSTFRNQFQYDVNVYTCWPLEDIGHRTIYNSGVQPIPFATWELHFFQRNIILSGFSFKKLYFHVNILAKLIPKVHFLWLFQLNCMVRLAKIENYILMCRIYAWTSLIYNAITILSSNAYTDMNFAVIWYDIVNQLNI